MGTRRSRVVPPEYETLPLSGGDWLLVKKRLNHGNVADAFALKYESDAQALGGYRTNLRRVGMEMILVYLIDWSLVELDGTKVIPIRGKSPDEVASALNHIDDDSFEEIKQAIAAYDTKMDAERAAEKKSQDGATESSAISPSPNANAGDTNGSTPLIAMSTT